MSHKGTHGYRIDAEIFSTGTWNDETFGREDLEEIVENFKRLRHRLKPPLKFGHDEHQTLLGQEDGDPALGWVERLRVVGDKLVATFAGVPEVVYRAIKAQRYKRVSAEIYFNLRSNGKRLGKALKAVALLGADLPAVTNLEDLSAFLTDRPHQDLQVGDSRIFTLRRVGAGVTPLIEEEHDMTEEASRQELETELETLRLYRAETEAADEAGHERTREQAFRASRQEAAVFCREQVRAGRLTPHLRDRLLAELDRQAQTFTAGAQLKVSLAWVRDFVRNSGTILPEGEVAFAATEPASQEPGPENPSDALAQQASAKMTEMNLSYGQAAEYVLKTDPALAKAYRDYTLNPTLGD